MEMLLLVSDWEMLEAVLAEVAGGLLHSLLPLRALTSKLRGVMLGEVITIVLGAALFLCGIFSKVFHVGFSPKARISIPAMQGRFWLILSGILLLSAGAVALWGNAYSHASNFVGRTLLTFNFGYEIFSGFIAVLAGLVFLFAPKDKLDFKGRLLGVAAELLGFFLITDALWKMRR
jgi:uncharacterized membrane protein HdeD (DUF308 family)